MGCWLRCGNASGFLRAPWGDCRPGLAAQDLRHVSHGCFPRVRRFRGSAIRGNPDAVFPQEGVHGLERTQMSVANRPGAGAVCSWRVWVPPAGVRRQRWASADSESCGRRPGDAGGSSDADGQVLQICRELSDIPRLSRDINSSCPRWLGYRQPRNESMIHLANDPNASRMAFRPAPVESKSRSFGHPRGPDGHAWPFLSRSTGRPAPQNTSSKTPISDSGS